MYSRDAAGSRRSEIGYQSAFVASQRSEYPIIGIRARKRDERFNSVRKIFRNPDGILTLSAKQFRCIGERQHADIRIHIGR